MQTFQPAQQLVFENIVDDIERLRSFLSTLEQTDWVFDLSQVTQCDSAGVALLIEAKRLSQLGEHRCLLQGMSSKMAALVEFCGVKHILQVEDVIN